MPRGGGVADTRGAPVFYAKDVCPLRCRSSCAEKTRVLYHFYRRGAEKPRLLYHPHSAQAEGPLLQHRALQQSVEKIGALCHLGHTSAEESPRLYRDVPTALYSPKHFSAGIYPQRYTAPDSSASVARQRYTAKLFSAPARHRRYADPDSSALTARRWYAGPYSSASVGRTRYTARLFSAFMRAARRARRYFSASGRRPALIASEI